MDRSWDNPGTVRQTAPDNETWEGDSNSSEDDSSIADYDGTDMPIPAHDIDLEDEEFPREDLLIVLEGLNKWPWTVYPTQLRNCLSAAAKIVHGGGEDASPELRRLQTLYRDAVPNAFEKCLDDKAIWKWNDVIHSNIFDALLRLIDVVVVKLPQLFVADAGTEDDVLPLLRSLSVGLDKASQYHVKHKEQLLPEVATQLPDPERFARPIAGSPARTKNGDWYCTLRKAHVRTTDGCACHRCRPPPYFCWLAYLMNYIGQGLYGNGYEVLLKVLQGVQRWQPAIMEALLQPVAKTVEFLVDDCAAMFLDPCKSILRSVSDLLERDVDALSDKTRDGSYTALSQILRYLQAIIGRSVSPEKADGMVAQVQRKMVERMLGFPSFNKQLSAVREINKLLENARSIAVRDNSQAVRTTIEWLEKNDILRRVLRSHLHHKQYVDQVEKIMRFLLQERCLSEEHLNAIWAATEKPDQFEAVKNNIFDLLADLAWSFSPEQLDSLFGRFERSQGRPASDIVKILQLVKKLARSDTKGVMATRLLELLWNMMHSGEVPEVLESGAMTEILGHYHSVNCASKDVYIKRCLAMVRKGESVIPSLRLLREIILLDPERPFYQNHVAREKRLQALNAEHELLQLVVGSLESWMSHARTLPLEVLTGVNMPSAPGPGSGTSPMSLLVDGRYMHEERVKEQLEFLLFALKAGSLRLPWDTTERLWNCLVEDPACEDDRQKGLEWFSNAMNKAALLTVDAQFNILTKKLTNMDPATLSGTAFRCFTRLFQWVNLNERKLKRRNHDDTSITHDLDLIGLSYVWKIILHSPVNDIVDLSIHMLRDIHTCLADALLENVVGIRQHFIGEVLERLEAAIEMGGIQNPGRMTVVEQSSDSMSAASGSVVDDDNNGDDKANKDSGSEEKVADRSTTRVLSSPTSGGGKCEASQPSVEQWDQVERCLRLLQVFILRCEGRCPWRIPSHGASFQGRPMSVEVSTANKQSTRFTVEVHANEYLLQLRVKVAKRLECAVGRVRLVHQGRELVHDAQVIRQCGISQGHTISASVNIVDRSLEPMDEEELPGVLISKRKEVYDILFKLTEERESKVREAANSLLMLLPTHPGMLADFQALTDVNTMEEAKVILDTLFGARSRLLYTLQVLDGILMPVNRSVTEKTHRFRNYYMNFGGFPYVLAVFQHKALPKSVDDQTRRGCYASALRLLKFLILKFMPFSETSKHQDSGAVPAIGGTGGTCLIRADGTVVVERSKAVANKEVTSIAENSNGAIETDVHVVAEKTDKVDDPDRDGANEEHCKTGMSVEEDGASVTSQDSLMQQVVACLTRLTWATALGKISAMGVDGPVSAVIQKTCQQMKGDSTGGQPMEETEDINHEDAYLCYEAMDLLVVCLGMKKSLMTSFFSSDLVQQFIVDMVLHSPDEGIRYKAAENFLQLSKVPVSSSEKVPLAHKYVLAALLGAKEEANKQPRQCIHYWELLCGLLSGIRGQEEKEMAEKQMMDEIKWLQSAPTVVDDKNKLLEGHLLLIRTLVEVLDCRIIGSSRCPGGRGLVEQLLKQFLFPEAVVLMATRGEGGALDLTGLGSGILPGNIHFGQLGSNLEDNGFLHAKCGNRSSRMRAFELLICLGIHCPDNMREIVDLLLRMHFTSEITEWEHLPSYGRKAVGGYVGLKNAGATCYMNSVFQQLYMQPDVRRSILACDECSESERPESVFFQLQAMFGALLGSSLDHYTPQGFWLAYRDYDGLPINLREHQDAFEFFNRLYDQVDETLKATRHEPTLTKIFGGTFAQQVICRGCPHRSEREEPFAAVSVDVKNKRNLLESLESFVRGDLLEADNAYYCEECGVKVDALKRVCVKNLPHALVIHLKRFDFDYESMQRLKLKDRFEFPTFLDMKPYTVEGLTLKEMQAECAARLRSGDVAGVSLDGSVDSLRESQLMGDVDIVVDAGSDQVLILERPSWYYMYELMGVVVHSGTAFAGHYYSYIKERDGDGPLNCPDHPGGRWMAFDDKRVEPYDISDLEKDCFGGKYTVEVYDNFLKTTSPQEFDRPNSAYMLLYERRPQSSEVPSSASPSSAAKSEGIIFFPDANQEGALLWKASTEKRIVQIPASIHRSVWEENQRFVHENHLLDRDYFRFLQRLINVNVDIIEARSRVGMTNTRCSEDQLEGGTVARGRADSSAKRGDGNPSVDVYTNELARLSMTLATEFLMRVLLHTHSSMREELHLWKKMIARLLESSPAACQLFLETLVERPNWLRQYLLKCHVDDVRQTFVAMLVHALRCCVHFLRGSSCVVDTAGRKQDILRVDAMIDVLVSLLPEASGAKTFVSQYFFVFLEYARLGPSQRSHLLQKGLVGQLIAVATHIPPTSKVDLTFLHSAISLLVRGCDISRFCEDSSLERMLCEEDEDQEMEVVNADKVVGSSPGNETASSSAATKQTSKGRQGAAGAGGEAAKSSTIPNPLQLPPPLAVLPDDAADALFMRRDYVQIVAETCPELDDAVKLLEYCSWQNERFSWVVLSDVMDFLQRAATSEARPLLALLLRLLQLNDSYQMHRQEAVLSGMEGISCGIMDLIVSKNLAHHKRYALLKFVVKLEGVTPSVRQLVIGRKVEWKRAVDWLQDEILTNGAPSPMSTPPLSNEEMTSGYLMRTSTAEWTLDRARNVLSP